MRVYLYIFIFLLAFGCKKTEPNQPETTSPADTLSSQKISEPRQVMGIAIVYPADNIIDIAAETEGLVKMVQVELGVPLKKGQVILQLDDAVDAAQLVQVQSRQETQQEIIQVELADQEILKVKIHKAEADVARNEALFQGKAVTAKELQDSRDIVKELQAQMDLKKAVVEREKRKLQEYSAELGYQRIVRQKKTVIAPADGLFITLDIEPGEYLNAQTTIGKFAPAGPVIALTEIDELFADRIQIGQKAIIRPQGQTEVLATGTVILAPPYLRKKSLFSEGASNLEDRRVREVRVQLEEASQVLLGARVECLITL